MFYFAALNMTTVALPTANTTCEPIVDPDISTGLHLGFFQVSSLHNAHAVVASQYK